MKKTLTINIGHSIFNIEEDAYDILNRYLDSIKNYFNKIDNDLEIIKDFELRIAEKNDAKQIKNKKGNVILVKFVANSIFSKSPTNPGAIIETNRGIKISITIVKNNKPKNNKLKISLANLFDCFFPLIISDE